MPKIKSHSGAKKRFRKTASGGWLHKKAGLSHLNIGKSTRRTRSLRSRGKLTRTQGKIMDKYLPYA